MKRMNFSITEDARIKLDELSEKLEIDKSKVMRRAIGEMHTRYIVLGESGPDNTEIKSAIIKLLGPSMRSILIDAAKAQDGEGEDEK
ncbi:MAG: hypothetical protein KAV42_01190 [Candidatus Krumholzibacteria bacterium]|nr:hypothetical protein [Candidatus Krumholzibacteria bacterium]